MIHHLFFVVLAACSWISMPLQAQESQGVEVVESVHHVRWEEGSAPVGYWGVEDGYWLDEIPWGVFETPWPEEWESGQSLTESESWVEIPEASLTSRQRQLLTAGLPPGEWRTTAIADAAQWTGPLLRWNSSKEVFERLMEVSGAFGRGWISASNAAGNRTREWPADHPMSEGTSVRLSIPKSGLYRIDRAWMVDAGFDPDTIDPRKVHLFGNGGALLPMDNAEDRALGLRTIAVDFPGSGDGSWDDGDELVFWGEGPDWIGWNSSISAWEHLRHPYEDKAWYFLTIDQEQDEGRISPAIVVSGAPDTTYTRYRNVQFHEQELESPNRSGREWFGESFGSINQRTFTFTTPYPTDETAKVSGRFAAQSMGVQSSFSVTSGDVAFNAAPSYTSSTSTSNVANLASASGEGAAASQTGLDADDALLSVQVAFDKGVSTAVGWLDYLLVEQPCHLKFDGAPLAFAFPASIGGLAESQLLSAIEGVRVWDITDGPQPREINLEPMEGGFKWMLESDTTRAYVAFAATSLPKPAFAGLVAPSNLHAIERADLVIVTRPIFVEAAQRLAALHADDGLEVLVTTQRTVFDEFSSGSIDPTAIKMLMMMLRDRALDGGWEPPKYLQLFGDGTYANRVNLEASPYVITYQSENSVSPTGSYVSDDYFGFLEDQYGEGIGDKLAIGVGRIACETETEANAMVDKIVAYTRHPSAEVMEGGCVGTVGADDGRWRNRICFVSDDMDGNGGPTEIEHMVNSDEHATKLAQEHPEYDVTKIYLDAYPQESTPGGERYPDAQLAIDRQVQDGALIVNYIGHGGERGWSHERILNTTTIQNWENLARMPLFMTATCELARFDDPEVDSAGEMMVRNPDGGAIAMLTTTRVVFSGSNQQLNRAFYAIALEDTGSAPLRLGDIVKVTKNDPQVSNSSNKRNFSLLGDPALQLNYPEHQVKITSLPDTLRALDLASVAGYVSNAAGDTLQGFDGIVHVQLFDKRSQITTLNNDGAPNPHTFQVFRNVLFRGVASVTNGTFAFDFVVPRDIDYSYGPGRISAYAVSDSTDAHGANESFIVGGVSDTYAVDETPPAVRLFMNDTLFASGGMTDENPWLLARVFDEGGINASGVGIGHDIKATLDGQSDESIVLNNQYTTDLNTYQSGTVRYPFEGLEEGLHTLELVVWDVQNNKGSAEVDFIVAPSLEAAIGSVMAYPNPSATGFNFNIEHNIACSDAQYVLEVFSASGALVHRREAAWHADGFLDNSVRWDQRNDATGAAVSAGVYIFRLTLVPESGAAAQYSDQLVVIRP